MKIKIQNNLLWISAILLFFATCKSKTEQDPLPNHTPDEISKGKVSMHLHNYYDIKEVDDYNVTYENSNGRQISLEMAQLYMSNFEFVRADGSSYTIPNSAVLKTQNVYKYELGMVPAGTYTTFRFRLGLDSTFNTGKEGASLNKSLDNPSMWYNPLSKTGGYIFLNFKGKIDTTKGLSADIAQMCNFNYKLGTSTMYKVVTMPASTIVVTAGKEELLHMIVDWNRVFNGIELSNSNNLSIETKEESNSALTKRLSNNIASMFLYEHVH
ncbi:MAG TPA: MbnP family protein [Cytophagaceae bacterium]|jgi:hypothetical protein